MAEVPQGPKIVASGPLDESFVANLRYDLPAGLVVFLVALPLCLGIALASDAPLISGIISGVVAGILVSPLSGSQLSVAGPAAGLTVIVAGGIATLGSFEAFLTAVILSGLMQLAAGLARFGVLANLFPSAVIKGMLAGIGIILVLKQIPHALGRDTDFEGDFDFWMMGHQSHTFSEIEAAVRSASPGMVVVSAVCLMLILLWERPFIARQAWTRVLPGPLAAVLAGVGINELYKRFKPDWVITSEGNHLVALPDLGSTSELWYSLPSPDLAAFGRAEVWTLAATLAAIGSLESLLSVEAVDKLDPWRRKSSSNRELLAQGTGNLVAGFLGGIPMTAVIVRSSANVYAGARTRTSGIVHGLLLGGLVIAVPALLNRIPLAALAAILLVIGYKLARLQLFRSMFAAGPAQFVPFMVTVVATVLTDLLFGVTLGFIVGVGFVILSNYRSAIEVTQEGGITRIALMKDVSFLNKTLLRTAFENIPNGATVVVDGSAAQFIDHDIYEQVVDFIEGAPHRGIRVTMRGMDSAYGPTPELIRQAAQAG